MRPLEKDRRTRLDRKDRPGEQHDRIAARRGIGAVTGAAVGAHAGVDDALVGMDQAQPGRLGREGPIGPPPAERGQDVVGARAAVLFVGFADHDQVAPQGPALEHPLDRFEQRRHTGLGVT